MLPRCNWVPAPSILTPLFLRRLEPKAEVISLFAPLALDGDRIAKILVKEGASVKAGQVVAILDARDRLQTAVVQAQQ